MNSKVLNIVFQRALITIFFIVIFGPSLKMIFEDRTFISVAEKRSLAELPSFPENFSQIQGFFPKVDTYLSDHFGFREWMVSRYQVEVGKRFKDASSVTEVLKGLDNWYFFTGNEMLKDFTGRDLKNSDDLKRWIDSFREKKKWLEERGIRYLFLVPPNKISVYSEFVGEQWVKNRGMSKLAQIKSSLTAADSSSFLDLTPALLKENHLDILYYKSDTHWTSYGAFLAYQAIADTIESMFPGVRFKRDFAMTPTITRRCEVKNSNCGDLTGMLLDYESFEESYREFLPFPRCAQKQPLTYELSNLTKSHNQSYFQTSCQHGQLKAVVFRDSFFGDLEPYFSENFKEVIYLWKGYDQNNIKELLSTFEPDIIIEEQVERVLYWNLY